MSDTSLLVLDAAAEHARLVADAAYTGVEGAGVTLARAEERLAEAKSGLATAEEVAKTADAEAVAAERAADAARDTDGGRVVRATAGTAVASASS